jgi:hypothetical protein
MIFTCRAAGRGATDQETVGKQMHMSHAAPKSMIFTRRAAGRGATDQETVGKQMHMSHAAPKSMIFTCRQQGEEQQIKKPLANKCRCHMQR